MQLDWPHISSRFVIFVQIIVLPALIGSCEEIIDVNLKNASSKVVIESFITTSNDPLMVKITESQGFFDQSDFVPVKNAIVDLEYLTKNERLVERGGGYYTSSNMKGVPGRTYTLKVSSAGANYEATVELPASVPIDTVYFKPGIFKSDSLNIYIEFSDPSTTENYYRLKLYRNRRYAVNDYYITTDVFSNGKKMVLPVYYRYFAPHDTIVVELQNLERSTWKYFKGLNETIQQGVNSQAPGNPLSNFTGGALGVFGAYGSSTYKAIIPGKTGKK